MPKTIWNVANRLPVTLGEDLRQTKKSSGGLVSALEDLSGDELHLRWIGWPGAEIEHGRRDAVRAYLQDELGATPVFLSAAEKNGFYEGFSNASLWPVLHYMPSRFHNERSWWQDYVDVNQKFADTVLANAADGDLVWVHDYQLMLVPRLLKEANASLRVGFFLHTPFPSYEIFRCLPGREQLVAGVLGADLIGFHTFGYMRHFRSCVLRLLGIDSELSGIRHDGRTTRLGVYPIGISAKKFNAELDSPEHRERRLETAARHKGVKIVLSVERMDYTKGIVQRLDAIDLFLQQQAPAARDLLKFVFVGVPSRGGIEEYQQLRAEVESAVGRINGKYATLNGSPVRFVHGSVSFTDLCAMYALADVCMVTPLIDGMNLVAKEYVACQRGCAADAGNTGDATPGAAGTGDADAGDSGVRDVGVRDAGASVSDARDLGASTDSAESHNGGSADIEGGRCGVLVLSEFAGAAAELHSAVIVNPYDTAAVAAALGAALEMPPAEKRKRMESMRERVLQHDAAAWARTYVGDLARHDPAPEVAPAIETARQRVRQTLAGGGRVAFFLDYDGTLREIERDPNAAFPSPAIRATVQKILRQAGLDVTIVSGRKAEDLGAWFADSSFGLVAEHGAAIRRPGSGDWEKLDVGVSYGWIEHLQPLLKQYADSTPGSSVELKHGGLVWHYRQADPEFGAWKAKELTEELSILTANLPVQIRHGRKIVEVAAAEVSKANAVQRVLAEKEQENGRSYDLVLCAGDDLTDESMFMMDRENLISIKIGHGDTRATYRLHNPAAFRAFLENCVTA